jgi:hypothetical protein
MAVPTAIRRANLEKDNAQVDPTTLSEKTSMESLHVSADEI